MSLHPLRINLKCSLWDYWGRKHQQGSIENKSPIENTEADESSHPSLPMGAVNTDTAPPPLVSEPKDPRTAIKQLRDIRSLLKEL